MTTTDGKLDHKSRTGDFGEKEVQAVMAKKRHDFIISLSDPARWTSAGDGKFQATIKPTEYMAASGILTAALQKNTQQVDKMLVAEREKGLGADGKPSNGADTVIAGYRLTVDRDQLISVVSWLTAPHGIESGMPSLNGNGHSR